MKNTKLDTGYKAATVGELIKFLQQFDNNLPVCMEKGNNDGCETCGCGETQSEISVTRVFDLETRIVISSGEL